MKDLGELKFFLGIEVSRSQKGILMCQSKYTVELVSEIGLSGCKPASTPIEFNYKLTSLEFDKYFNHNSELDKELTDSSKYQILVRRLLYLTITRPDIAFVVQVLSPFMHSPKKSHMEVALRVVRHIKGTAGLGLFMPSSRCSNLVSFCDSGWGSCVETRKSVTGHIVNFGNAVIS
ncbi:uncharacterized mitochondrial protein AtMg00810-like [Capsicum annuum]|uniref:uncharacterized mitochondrial protein AtMg00810-like n=1 Tax=Capsicum annuum TaxID=4072 RepID=UPI001FB1152A|nr:uncharacterized mitochondrial protein AtMg00810-like [Capsicum annuum]